MRPAAACLKIVTLDTETRILNPATTVHGSIPNMRHEYLITISGADSGTGVGTR